MKSKQTLVLAALAVSSLLTLPALAAWSARFKPTKVYAGYTSGAVYIDGAANSQSCGSATIEFVPASSDPAKIMPLATAALLGGRNLQCNVSGCRGNYQKGSTCSVAQ